MRSTAAADVSDGSINLFFFRGRFEHGVWKRRNIGRCGLMMGWNRRAPGKASIGRQRGRHGRIRRAHQGVRSERLHATTVHAAPRVTGSTQTSLSETFISTKNKFNACHLMRLLVRLGRARYSNFGG